LPICAICKNIRDDKGYWNRVEEYISKYLDVEFSHGICPECAQKHYPEFYKSKD
jgi:predicted nucleic-acid-binding Zn-ribbon protein